MTHPILRSSEAALSGVIPSPLVNQVQNPCSGIWQDAPADKQQPLRPASEACGDKRLKTG